MNKKLIISVSIALFLISILGVRILIMYQKNENASDEYREKIKQIHNDLLETEKNVLLSPNSEASLALLEKAEHNIKSIIESGDRAFKKEAQFLLKEIEEKRKMIEAVRIKERKALEYETVYEKDGFEIREAFLGADFKPCHKFYEEEKGKCETIPRIHNFTCTDDQFNQEFFDCEWEKTGNLLEAGSPELYCEIEIEDTLWKVVKLTTDQTFSIYKNNELILTQETGSMCCGGVMAVKNIDGRFIVAASSHIGEDEQQAWIFVDGKLAEKMKFQSLFAPLKIDNKAVYISRIHNQYTVFFNEKAVGEGYEEVQIYKDCLDTYWKYDIQGNGNIIDFLARKQDGWYYVQAGYFAGFKSRQYQ